MPITLQNGTYWKERKNCTCSISITSKAANGSSHQKRHLIRNPNNSYLFPRKDSEFHIRGTDCLRKFSEECGAEAPERLCSTWLRKQIATMSQILNLHENILDILAQFLGHDIRVHRDFYRLSSAKIQVAKVSTWLLAME